MLNKLNLTAIFFIVAGLAGCSSLDVAVSNKFDTQKKIEKVVVFPFQITGTKCGSEFSDAVSHQFVKSEKVDVVEREALDKLIDEDKLSMTGLIDERKAAAIGKKLGVDAIILGRGTAEEVKGYNCIKSFSLKMISVETGTHMVTIRMAEGKNPRYDDLARDMVSEVIDAMNTIERKKEARQKAAEAAARPKEETKAASPEPAKAK
ncbi:MAG: CsgG/HfaB family protein [Spirochaetota bacterium]